MEKEYFNHYDDPERAKIVWNAYMEDIKEQDEKVQAYFNLNSQCFLEDCSNVWDLDLSLTGLIGMAHSQIRSSPFEPNDEGKVRKTQHIQNSDGNWSHVDLDSFGSWSLVVKRLEDLK